MIYQLFGELGYRVEATVHPDFVDFLVEEVVRIDLETREPLETVRYLICSVRPDGCSEFIFGDEDQYIHLCGAEEFTRHIRIMEFIYKKAFELMERKPLPGEEWQLEIKEIEE